jgi:hypothetical protein
MQPQFCVLWSSAHHRLAAFVPMTFLLCLTPAAIHAQYPQYAPPPPYAQQPYGQQPYSQQPYPVQQAYPAQQYAAQPYDSQPYSQAPPSPIYDQPNPQPGYAQAQPMSPEQLEQLVAPIALYPDGLVAQILAAATYPAQVVGADHWLRTQGYASPDQIVYGADAQSWDPSVKALTAFPQVLAQMDHDIQWTTDLGNAFYNQPQDVLQTIQVLRQRAENAGNLQSTPQEAVSYNQGYIQLAPVNPQVVYVPAYNPWDVYGQPIQPYSGFSLLGSLESFAGSGPVRFGLGIAMSAFSHSPFGWATWALNWLTQSILFNHSDYTSQSTTVAHWNNYPHGGLPSRTPRGLGGSNLDAANRGAGYARPATEFSRSQAYAAANRPYAAYRGNEAPNREAPNHEAPNRGYQQPGNFVRPGIQDNFAYNRPEPSRPESMTAREQAYGRSGYQSGYQGGNQVRPQGGYQQPYAGRPSASYASPQQSWRTPSEQRNDFAQRSYQPQRSYLSDRSYSTYGGSRNFAEARPEQSGASHFFGGGHNSDRSYGSYKAPKNSFKEPKAPKEHSHGGGHSGGGGHHGGGHRH